MKGLRDRQVVLLGQRRGMSLYHAALHADTIEHEALDENQRFDRMLSLLGARRSAGTLYLALGLVGLFTLARTVA